MRNESQHHHTETEKRGTAFVAVCSCGWVSQPQTARAGAEHEATDHVVAVTF
jgi:hypothetical protein